MNDNEITTIAEGCDPERCTDRVGGEHAETCAHFYRPAVRTGDALADCASCGMPTTDPRFGAIHEPSRSKKIVAESRVDPRWATSAWTDG